MKRIPDENFSIKQLIPLNDHVCAMPLQRAHASKLTAFDATSSGWEVYRALIEETFPDGTKEEYLTFYTNDPDGNEECMSEDEILFVPNYLCPDCSNRTIPSVVNKENTDLVLYKCPVCGACMTFYLGDPYKRFYERRVRI